MSSQLLILTKLFFVMVSDDGHNDDGDDDKHVWTANSDKVTKQRSCFSLSPMAGILSRTARYCNKHTHTEEE